MKNKFKQTIMALSNTIILSSIIPQACAALKSLPKIIQIINSLLVVFRGAGVILLAYSIISLVLALKDENADAKVQASTQIAVAVVCITLSSIISTISNAAGVNMTLK